MYYLQSLAPAGNWVDVLGIEAKTDAEAIRYLENHAKAVRDGRVFRIVQRADLLISMLPEINNN